VGSKRKDQNQAKHHHHLPELPDEVIEAGEIAKEACKKAGKRASKIVAEFKEFISRGNVTDMAVGIIVGTAFTATVNSIVNDVVMPLIGLILGGIDLTTLSATVNSPFFADLSVTVEYGLFLQSVVSFLVIAICVFFMVKTLNAFRRRIAPPPPEKPAKPDEHIVLLTEIRDLLGGVRPTIEDDGQLTFEQIDEPLDNIY